MCLLQICEANGHSGNKQTNTQHKKTDLIWYTYRNDKKHKSLQSNKKRLLKIHNSLVKNLDKPL